MFFQTLLVALVIAQDENGINERGINSPQARLNKTKRFMLKWINNNLDDRYKRSKKVRSRYEDYVRRLQWALDSECSRTFVANDEDIDKDINEVEEEERILARSDIPDLSKKVGTMNRLMNLFLKFTRINLSACPKKNVWDVKADKLRAAFKKGLNRSVRVQRKFGPPTGSASLI